MSDSNNPAQMRRDYGQAGLDEAEVGEAPMPLFERWFNEAVASNAAPEHEPNAMTLATADATGRPDARIVLLKQFDERGFVFFTNYRSRKADELEANAAAALLWFWPWLERQVRVVGTVAKVEPELSDAYFADRPRASQLGAWASAQSQPTSREQLEQRMAELDAEYEGRPIPRPPHWGGYRVAPREVEFWQGRPSRLHDRIRFRRSSDADESWQRERLSP